MPSIARLSRIALSDTIRSSLEVSGFVMEYLLDRHIEQTGNAESERERRIVFSGFDCIHGLARHVEVHRQFGL